jgi:hypothetical protein
MADNCKEYIGVSRQALAKFREQSEKSGQPLPPGDSYVIEKSGIKLSVEYIEADQTLKMCILEKPGFIPDSMVWAVVDDQMRRGSV